MEGQKDQVSNTEVATFLDQLNIFFYISGIKNIWVSDLKLPKTFIKIYDKVLILAHPLLALSMISVYLTFFTQDNLSMRHTTDLVQLSVSTPVVHHHLYTLLYYKAEVRDILYNLFVVLREYYNDNVVQSQRIKNIKRFLVVFMCIQYVGIFERAVASLIKTIRFGEVFNPFATVWPDGNIKSTTGVVARSLNFFLILWHTVRLNGVNGMILLLLLAPSYQFQDIQSYFRKLEEIFEDNNLSQVEKEKKYENGLKRGIYAHALTLRCMRRIQHVCRMIFSLQMFKLTGALVGLLPAVIASKSFTVKLSSMLILLVQLGNLGILMLNSGKVTFEAQHVSDAMYTSGWQNCHGTSSVRVRKLIFIGMVTAKQPLVLKAFGFIEMTYANFVMIVKTSYTVFSIFY